MNLAKMSDVEEQQVREELAWWREFEHGGWKVKGFTNRTRATFRHTDGNEVQVTGKFMEGLICRPQ